MTARSDFGFRVLVGFAASCTTESCFRFGISAFSRANAFRPHCGACTAS